MCLATRAVPRLLRLTAQDPAVAAIEAESSSLAAEVLDWSRVDRSRLKRATWVVPCQGGNVALPVVADERQRELVPVFTSMERAEAYARSGRALPAGSTFAEVPAHAVFAAVLAAPAFGIWFDPVDPMRSRRFPKGFAKLVLDAA
jgi:hypothetical protein